MPQQRYYLAIDIGASSGRHVLGSVNSNGVIELEEVHRFDNVQVRRRGHDCWDIDMIWENILVGLEKCRKAGKIPETIGIDTWGVDFVLVDAQGRLVGDAVAYRDARTNDVAADVDAGIGLERLYRVTGIQRQAFNTIYQLAALSREHPEELETADRFLMVPEYLNYLLTGNMVNEYTNATTAQLVNLKTGEWDMEMIGRLGYPAHLFGRLSMPGEVLGKLSPEIRERVGYDLTVIHPASHDTGSAVLAVPSNLDNIVYLSSGTWSLMGVERTTPDSSAEARLRNFTNEGGVDGTVRFLKNITGMWLLEQCRAVWSRQGREYSYEEIVRMTEGAAPSPGVIDPDAAEFAAPTDMPQAIRAWCAAHGVPSPADDAALMRLIFDSLAAKYAEVLGKLRRLAPFEIECLHVIGGGAQNDLLNRMTADAVGIPVVAGPAEATALGNIMVQARAAGVVSSLAEMRRYIGRSIETKTYQPKK